MGKNTNITIYDIAGMARVSMATVSRVLNAPDRVNVETRDKVLKIIEEVGYKPNPIARELATKKRTHVVGIVILNITHDLVSQILSGVFEAADDFNFSIKLFQISKKKKFSDFISDIMIEKVDSILFLNDCLEDEKINAMINNFETYKTPHVLIDINDTKTAISPHKCGFDAINFLCKNM